MNICLIIINYNGYHFLNKYLEDTLIMCKNNRIALIITDDRSSDDSVTYLKENNYDYTINRSEIKGFASNVNNGIKYAQKRGGYEFYIIANNDIKIRKGLFEFALPKALSVIQKSDEFPGLIGFDEILEDRNDYFENYDFKNYDGASISSIKEIPGFFFLLNQKLIDRIGYFDEEYFMYGEDNDYFIRTLKGGFQIYNTFLPIRHYSEGSSRDEKKTSWYVYRNALLYAQKNKSFFGVLRMLFAFLWKIYNPFYKSQGPSNLRITRNGFFYNNFLLLKSLKWNLEYYIKKKKYE